MYKANFSATSITNGIDATSGTFAFLQDGYSLNDLEILISQIGGSYNPATPYILYGCVATVGSPNTAITAGSILYNGEIFSVPAQTFTSAGGGNVILCNINTAYTYVEPDGVTNADPASYEDGTPRDTYAIRTIDFTTGGTGTGLFDFSVCVRFPSKQYTNAGITFAVIGGYPMTQSASFGYKIQDNNELVLSGSLESVSIVGSGSGATTIITLPIPPLENTTCLAYVSQPGGTSGIQEITIDTSGNLIVNIASIGHSLLVWLTGVSYRIS